MEANCCTFLFLLLIKSQGLCAPNVLSSWELMVCWTVHMTFLWMDCSPYFSPVNSLYTLINRISFSFFYALNYSTAFSDDKFFIFLCFSMGIKQIYHLHSPVNIQSNFKYSSCSLWGGSVMNLGTKKHRQILRQNWQFGVSWLFCYDRTPSWWALLFLSLCGSFYFTM